MSEMNSNDLVSDSNSKAIDHRCKICEAPALHANYGAMTCSPCKMFFKRNAEKGQEQFTCTFDGHCEINVDNRHVCATCRLAKCFANGMQAERIRCPISKKEFNIIKEKNGGNI